LQILLQDLRYALRQLRRNPGFAVVAVATLALGIGANTAIFSMLNAVVLRSLPVRDPRQLMLFGKGTWAGSMDSLPDRSWQLFSYPFFREFRQQNQAFSEVAAISSIPFGTHGRVAGGDKLEKIDAELVSGTYFNTLGVTPILGPRSDRYRRSDRGWTPGRGGQLLLVAAALWKRPFCRRQNGDHRFDGV
jgi:hypothetical protein